jgi:hypothetical protein
MQTETPPRVRILAILDSWEPAGGVIALFIDDLARIEVFANHAFYGADHLAPVNVLITGTIDPPTRKGWTGKQDGSQDDEKHPTDPTRISA